VENAHNIIIECPVCGQRVGGGTFDHFGNGVLLEMIKDVVFIVITTKLTIFLLN
jgi:hypothetical protein